MKHKIGILGAGTWGMALARMLTVSGNDVTVWSALEQEIDNLSTTRVHPNLPGMTIPAEMKFTKSVEEVCTDKEILLFAVPSVFVRSTAAKARPFVPDGQIIVDVPSTFTVMGASLAVPVPKPAAALSVIVAASVSKSSSVFCSTTSAVVLVK